METIYVHEERQYDLGRDVIDCAWSASCENGTRIHVVGTLGGPAEVLKGLADVVTTWEAFGSPKTKLEPLRLKGIGRRLAVTVQGHFVRSVEELPD